MVSLKKIYVTAKGFCFRSANPTLCGVGADFRTNIDKYSGFRIFLIK